MDSIMSEYGFIGGLYGLFIPKTMLEQSNFTADTKQEVSIKLESEDIIISTDIDSSEKPRHIDEFGRVFLPSKLCKEAGMNESSPIIISLSDSDTIRVTTLGKKVSNDSIAETSQEPQKGEDCTLKLRGKNDRAIEESEEAEENDKRKAHREYIGENLCNHRKQKNLSLEEMSGFLDITPGLLGLVEKGRRMFSIYKLCQCAEIFGTTVDELVRYKENPLK